ncbi:MAG: hypothetical protein LKF37_10085 [Lentilactobacillus diolivorans]|nr:hypothetical protein [Lentilactobacillus diolivorans]
MKLKKIVAGAATMSFLGLGIFSSSQQVSAASWHKGTPKTVRNKTYELNSQKDYLAQVGYTFKSNSINAWTGANGQGLYVYSRAKYKKIGSHLYYVKVHDDNVVTGSRKAWFKVKILSEKRIYVKDSSSMYHGYAPYKYVGSANILRL